MFKIKITGLDKLRRDLRDAQAGLRNLDGNIAKLQYDPNDPQSVKAAIREMERAVDRKAGRFRSNPIIADLTKGMKASYRTQMLEKARRAGRSS